ncbi:hypothetical protein LTR56_012426 [Elasticomyces elasticus]|nr:hypothetical protein LTR22_020809 [Elasticomyces elasticus]KAK3639455.1 hypothetical protein LTR56_012426 [Elasticomyces elasticus]KAK4909633.1 hypothetical protein LTR49_021607 [Elasticomyces elasticus]KAK5752717.1 hypothetical protein LTS12_017189 [Elasticomyces elasticus]
MDRAATKELDAMMGRKLAGIRRAQAQTAGGSAQQRTVKRLQLDLEFLALKQKFKEALRGGIAAIDEEGQVASQSDDIKLEKFFARSTELGLWPRIGRLLTFAGMGTVFLLMRPLHMVALYISEADVRLSERRRDNA